MVEHIRLSRQILAAVSLGCAFVAWPDLPTAFLGASQKVAWWVALTAAGLAVGILWVRPFDRRVAGIVALTGLFLASHGIAFGQRDRLQPVSEKEGTVTEISILVYNVLFRGGVPGATVDAIESAAADIVLLQEVTPQWERRLRQLEGYTFARYRSHVGTHGLALLSRYPISNTSYLNNQRGLAIAQCADIAVKAKIVAVCNIHTASPAIAFYDPPRFAQRWERNAMRRTRQWRKIAAHAKARDRVATIVGGDLNTLETEPLYDEVVAEYADAYRMTNWGIGATFPNLVSMLPLPVVRIDYLFVSGRVEPLTTKVLPRGGSDHMALWAQVRL